MSVVIRDGALAGVRRLVFPLLALAVLAVGVAGASAHGEVRWRSEPALSPPPPPGVTPAPYPVPVGQVGQISFWAPNRGLLITGGTEGELKGQIAAGLYAYDGVSWHQLATVCGGQEGRIAWAGPDEFWTISDQRAGQTLAPGTQLGRQLRSISLCHFLDGQVVGSYAMPLEEPGSYLHMDAAACYGPSDCWFGGERGFGANAGAFHLHWNGSTVQTVYEPLDHAVTGMAMFAGKLYESVQMQEGDTYLPSEESRHPAVLHTIAPDNEAQPCGAVEAVFCELLLSFDGTPLPEYGKGVMPDALQGFDIATDGPPLEAGATQLWAAANPYPGGSGHASLTVLRYDKASNKWIQILGGGAPSPLGEAQPAGSETEVDESDELGVEDAIAPEPGSEAAWVSLSGGGGAGAEVARLDAQGKLSEPGEPVVLPEAGEPVGYRGEAGPIVCPAIHDCWLATVTESVNPVPGWLFHLSDGERVAPNTDPFFDGQDGVISFRPEDDGLAQIYPPLPPIDDSLINQQAESAPSAPAAAPGAGQSAPRGSAPPLVEHVKSKFVHGRTLVISFLLTARAHVRLVGRRERRVVASTLMRTLGPGRHSLSLQLNPASWPTAIQFHATPIGAPGASLESEPSGAAGGPEAGAGNGPTTVITG